ncbi:hypothetical protein B4113_0793 [Geobacillus sp. B4113_201601]|nr:hypothetical protein B4113_0793 [Geobacillus sp. B4113_201601]
MFADQSRDGSINANMSGQDRSRYLAGKPAARHPLKANVSGRDR